MKITTLKILQASPALQQLAGQTLPARAAFVLGRLMRQTVQAAKDYEDARLAACKRHGEVVEGENRYDIRAEARPAFEAEIADLQAADVELTHEPLALDALGEAQVTPAQMVDLEWAFKE